jgi:hypothetical protein
MCDSVPMRRYPKYQNRYQRRRARRRARRKGNQQHARQSANTRGALWLRLIARLLRVLRSTALDGSLIWVLQLVVGSLRAR